MPISRPAPHRSIAWFISPHGFGHASRACAMMQALAELDPGLHFHIFTTVPAWFFEESLSAVYPQPAAYSLHKAFTDIGLVQHSPTDEDLPATVRELESFLPFTPERIAPLREQILRLGCRLVVCDIAPLGIAAAAAAGVPSVLVENFTWDWIYAGYFDCEPRLKPYAAFFGEIFKSATFHVQTEPVCEYSASAHLVAPPASRSPRRTSQEIRQSLGIPPDDKLVLWTMGGMGDRSQPESDLPEDGDTWLVVPGGASEQRQEGRRILLPFHTRYYHPDLVSAADLVVGKAGYSTIAEAYQAGAPFAYVPRPGFRESTVLAGFIERELGGVQITETDLRTGGWLPKVRPLLYREHPTSHRPNGALPIARFIWGESGEGMRREL